MRGEERSIEVKNQGPFLSLGRHKTSFITERLEDRRKSTYPENCTVSIRIWNECRTKSDVLLQLRIYNNHENKFQIDAVISNALRLITIMLVFEKKNAVARKTSEFDYFHCLNRKITEDNFTF